MSEGKSRDPFYLARKPLYAVLFSASGDPTIDQGPFGATPQEGGTAPHGFDADIIDALPGLWYCMHLPNTLMELTALPAGPLAKGQSLDLAHEILLCPIQLFTRLWVNWAEILVPTLVVCPDDLLDSAQDLAAGLGFALPVTRYREFSDEKLAEHWSEIHRVLAPKVEYVGRPPQLTKRLDLAPIELPLRWLSRQFGASAEPVADAAPSDLLESAMSLHTHLKAIVRLETEGVDKKAAKARLQSMLREEAKRLRFPMAIAAAGVPNRYARIAFPGFVAAQRRPLASTDPADSWTLSFLDREESVIERAVMELLISHRAVAKTGIGLMLPDVPQQAFNAVAQLEAHYRSQPSPRAVKAILNRINDAATSLELDSWAAGLLRASTVTAFTNFPIGLLRIGTDTDPMCCRVPIAYRPLLPLTRALQQELRSSPSIDFSEGFRLLIAECISPGELVGKLSREGWAVATRAVERVGGIEVQHADVRSAAELRTLVQDHAPHILVLSAHGAYLEASNASTVVIGDEVCFGDDLGPQPPVVILSACSVAPRGVGTVTIADTLIRQGAEAVLGTQVPVDVRRNAMLMMRFFIYIAESVSRNEPEVTLLDAWHRTSTTNAINDILSGNRRLEEWGFRAREGRLPVIQEFMLEKSVGRLRRGTIYSDTEQVLGEMADDDGIGDQVRNWLRDPGYVPETLFYMFMGRPDRVTLRNPVELSKKAWREIRGTKSASG